MSQRYAEGTLNQRDNNRTQLFGDVNRFNSETERPSSPYTKNASFDYSQSSLAQLESQSEEQVGQMKQKVQALKNLSLKMGDEIRGSNHTLNDLNNSFHNASNKLKGTFNNMIVMAKKSKIGIKTWLIIFLVIGLLFFWVWIT
ncbi:hypothetical protein KAFR_0K01130 [Kazachstania africana CBS 2517]|uniref:t-SNARE coiled-coil homology domain-containing protein n=1 Tax=Kazachstania africana (strain ATCC 22294 / BCRC 22015 / CBS 2517 / CECT 1963 / NBRC 1671 / NRRL Y-8276) TaxID=1071382 RepID=H2B1G8_KAZAF|nr:hypothetical protein KAFR_0K01130 [Kazachstania africana CBS 2517]CCF60468.1 hypothetical protein KAFR_0K01130 [Kazachstania africana CBS 2517]